MDFFYLQNFRIKMENQSSKIDPPPSYEVATSIPFNNQIQNAQSATSAHQQVPCDQGRPAPIPCLIVIPEAHAELLAQNRGKSKKSGQGAAGTAFFVIVFVSVCSPT